jgi:hypothetical protein
MGAVVDVEATRLPGLQPTTEAAVTVTSTMLMPLTPQRTGQLRQLAAASR